MHARCLEVQRGIQEVVNVASYIAQDRSSDVRISRKTILYSICSISSVDFQWWGVLTAI